MTAGNSTPLTDGASAVLLASEEWAKERGLPVLAYFVDGQTAAVDYVHKREGLLMAPAYAMPPMLDRNGLTLQDFDFYEIHEAFAAQVLCTLHAWEDPAFCKERLGLDAPLGVDRPREAQRQRRLAGRRAPLRRDRRAHRRQPGQGAARARLGPRPDQHLRRRRPGRRRDPRKRRRDSDERSLLPAGQRPRSSRRSRGSSACRSRSTLERYRPGAAGRLRPGALRRSPGRRASAKSDRAPMLGRDPSAERAGDRGPGQGARLRRHRDRRLDRAGRAAALLLPGGRPARSATAASSSSARRPARPARPARQPRSARWRASPARSARRSAARRDRAARLRRAGRRGPARLDPALPALAALGLRLRPGRPRRHGRRQGPEIDWERPLDGKLALVTGASRGIGAAIAATLARDGAEVVGLDVPQAPDDLAQVTNELGGKAIELDITAADAPERIADALRRRRRRRRPQRRRHPRPHDRQDARGALERS